MQSNRFSVRQEVWLNLNPRYCSERIARQFLLDRSDTVRFTASENGEAERRQVLEGWQEYLLNEQVSNRRHPDVLQPDGPFVHYTFELSPEIREALNQQGLFWWDTEGIAGLEDPTFYTHRDGWATLLGTVISREGMIALYLNPTELSYLKQDANFATYEVRSELVIIP